MNFLSLYEIFNYFNAIVEVLVDFLFSKSYISWVIGKPCHVMIVFLLESFHKIILILKNYIISITQIEFRISKWRQHIFCNLIILLCM